MNDNIIDATEFFVQQKTGNIKSNLGNNRSFRAYCDRIGKLAIKKLIASDCYDAHIDNEFFSLESDDIVDVTKQEHPSITAQKLADQIIKECATAGIKICVDSILFRKLIYGKVPDRVSLTLRIGSRTS